jgi:hypothetical protein
VAASDFRIVITPTRDHFHNRDDRSQAETLVHRIQDGLSAARLVGTASISIVRHAEPPSRFHATPAQIDAFLRHHFAEDTLLRYQQAIGGRAVTEAARDIRSDTNLRKTEGENRLAKYGRELADLVDPLKDGGPYPSELINLTPKEN